MFEMMLFTMIPWPLVRAEMRRNPPPIRQRDRKMWIIFWLGFWLGGTAVGVMVLAWRLYLPMWTLGV